MNISTHVRWLAPLAVAASFWSCSAPLSGEAWTGGTPGNSSDPSESDADASAGGGSLDGAPVRPGSSGSVDGSTSTGPASACGPAPSTFCDVQAITQTYHCVTCHAATPVGGAPMSLITYADFLAPAKSNSAKTVAQLVLERTSAKTMPPAGFTPLSVTDEAKIASWISAGLTASCVSPTPPATCNADAGMATGSSSGGPGSSGSAIDSGTGTSTGTGTGTGSGSSGGGTTSSDGGAQGNFCAVEDVIQRNTCLNCHTNPPVNGAPMSLLTYADLTRPAITDATKIVGQLVYERTTARTMPPGGVPALSQADLQTLATWLNTGHTAACPTPVTPPTGGAMMDAGTGTGTSTGTGTGTGTGGSTGGGTTSTDGGAATQASFCAVQNVIQRNTCLNCHTNPPVNGAPMSLLTYADFTRPAVTNNAVSVGQLVLARTTARTMPPGGVPALSQADLTTISTWLNAGSPNVCPSPPTGGGTGATPDAGGGTTGGSTTPDAGGGTTGGGTTTINPTLGTSANDPWCAVVRDVAPVCANCHTNPPINSAPMPLLTYANWTTHAVTQPTVIVGNLALTRMSNGTMPPGGGATAQMIADVQNWVNGGMANSTCGQATGDAGAGVVDPFSSAPVCTSKQTMTTPNGPTMRPGEACLSCHTGGGGGGGDDSSGGGGDDNGGGGGDDGEAAAYTIAGTVYPTAHEPNDCVGAVNGGGAIVTIMDAAGRSIPLTPNAVGNFFYAGTVTFPITAKITKGNLSRSMTTPQTTGNCNSCHTQNGANGAPGRILEPF